jgi:hypothetical protein
MCVFGNLVNLAQEGRFFARCLCRCRLGPHTGSAHRSARSVKLAAGGVVVVEGEDERGEVAAAAAASDRVRKHARMGARHNVTVYS